MKKYKTSLLEKKYKTSKHRKIHILQKYAINKLTFQNCIQILKMINYLKWKLRNKIVVVTRKVEE